MVRRLCSRIGYPNWKSYTVLRVEKNSGGTDSRTWFVGTREREKSNNVIDGMT